MSSITRYRSPVAPPEAAGHDTVAESLRERYGQVRRLTELLAEPLSPEDQTVQSMPDVSPTKWHLAHTSWFFETFLLEQHLGGYTPFDTTYAYLFNSYYETVGPRYARARRGCVSRPGCADIRAYRASIDANMRRLLDGRLDPDVAGLVELGLHHEQQHQELLLMDIKHVLSMSPLDPSYRPGEHASGDSGPPGREMCWYAHPGGLACAGHEGDGFCFDNELPRHEVRLAPFAVADRLVTCGEWQDFIDDGGYRDARLWLSDGWHAVQESGWEAPLYWSRDGDRAWTVFTLTGRRRVGQGEPVCHVSYYEADAFATWAGARLPTEFEWEVAAAGRPVEGQLEEVGSLHPVRQETAGMFGGAWAWTSSAYLPYPGFRPAPGAVGEYNGKFMVNQHVLRGGSCVTPSGHVRATYRNFFPPSARWPFAGVRLAKDL